MQHEKSDFPDRNLKISVDWSRRKKKSRKSPKCFNNIIQFRFFFIVDINGQSAKGEIFNQSSIVWALKKWKKALHKIFSSSFPVHYKWQNTFRFLKEGKTFNSHYSSPRIVYSGAGRGFSAIMSDIITILLSPGGKWNITVN